MRLAIASLSLCLWLAPALGCGGDDDDDDGGLLPDAGAEDGDDDDGGDAPDASVGTGLPELEEGWTEILPAGDTICSGGSPFAYFVRKGTVNKVVIDYVGGGACWNEITCSFADGLFQSTVDSVRAMIEGEDKRGFYDEQNPDNPFKDWYHVVVPYCTGDVHWGDAVVTYGEGGENEVTINHKGAVNSRAVLDWVFESFASPAQVMVTGCSAGSYGAALWSAWVMENYPDSEVFQFGDSGAGIITEEFFRDSFPSWNATAAFPAFIPELDPDQIDILETALPDLYAGVANHFPGQWMSQYNSSFDVTQTTFYSVMGGEGGAPAWSAQMQDSIAEIEERVEGFSSFIAPGEQHCILPAANFYTVESNGVRLVDWLDEMLTEGGVDSVACQGAECEMDTP